MCGRLTLTQDPSSLLKQLDLFEGPQYNIGPTEDVITIAWDNGRKPMKARWGLLPEWSRGKMKSTLINARCETLLEKPSFEIPFRKQRNIIIADGFHEWLEIPGKKATIPIYVRMKSKEIFGIAGIWDTCVSPKLGKITSCSVVTTTPNGPLAMIHDRAPVILDQELWDIWLNPDTPIAELQSYFKSYPAELMEYFPVTTKVNKVAYKGQDCTMPEENYSPNLF